MSEIKPILFEPVPSPFLVPFDGSFRMAAAATAPPDGGCAGSRHALRQVRQPAAVHHLADG